TVSTPCGVALLDAPGDEEPPPEPGGTAGGGHGTEPSAAAAPPAVCKPVPLGQAPLHRVASTG
ncbi:hypothetical protein DKT74_05965, partial [Streptomyces sp. ZEA17I]